MVNNPSEKRRWWLPDLAGGRGDRPSLLLIGLFTLASLLTLGYRFAVWDQLLYLSCVERFFLPIVNHPHDLYIQTFLWRTYTSFWLLFYPLKQLFGWEWPLFVIYLLVKFFLLWGLWSLSFALTKDRLTAWLSLLLLLANKAIVGGGVQLYMPDTITRYVVIPFMLFGMRKLWERKYLSSALLFGIGFQIHAMSAVFWLLAAGIGSGIHWVSARRQPAPAAGPERPGELRRIGIAVLLFGLFAVPMLVWFGMTQPHPAGDFNQPDYLDMVRAKHGYIFLANTDPTAWRNLLLCLVLIVVAARHLPVDASRRWYLPWTFGIIGVLFIHFLAADVFLYQPIYKLQMCRIMDLLGVLGMIGAARLLARQAQGTASQRWLAAWVGALLLTGVVATGWTAEFFSTAVFFLLLLEFEPAPGRLAWPASLIFAVFLVVQLIHPPNYGEPGMKGLMWPGLRVALLASGALLLAGWFHGRVARWAWVGPATGALCLTGLLGLVWFERVNITEVKFWRGVDPDIHRGYWEKTVGKTREKIDWPGTGLQSDWVQFQFWVRDHTPPGTIFFVPPALNGFRVFSQRNAFLETYDVEPTILETTYGAALIERLKVFKYWPPTGRNFDGSDQFYHSLKAEDWQRLALQWDVPYLITAHPINLPFPKLYERGWLTLWQIGPPTNDRAVTTP